MDYIYILAYIRVRYSQKSTHATRKVAVEANDEENARNKIISYACLSCFERY